MPALTRRGKRTFPTDFEEEDNLGDEMVGILAQRSARREAREQELIRAREELLNNGIPVPVDLFILIPSC
jgi:hypothetical protein